MNGVLIFLMKTRRSTSNVGITIIRSYLNKANIVLVNNNGFQIQSPILGVVNFVVDGNGNIIISNLARNISETNQVENISDQKHSGT